ncbi:Predicted dehydrogenase [Paenibacillus sp. yr247]|uniref:Gfo/Idh/MocA family protein n=1 Tax=Paenibacillus sp. yr247 TaxID=1761880 RepID=UPI00088D637C|nr:Gfo/Idh/MocA family oxidoreductase [Paenibacillus sp. yr247]SDO22498.1 Predicted dehydrogenase [Paenibacillus sp. yr247]
MEPRQLRVFCIGLQNHWLSHWGSRPDVEVVGVSNRYQEANEHYAHLPQFEDIQGALQKLNPDLVTMVTPPYAKTCMETIRTVVESGFDIYLEKFRPQSWEDGATMVSLSRSRGRQIAIGESYRFDKFVEQAKRVILSGKLGELGQIVWRCQRPNIRAAWMNEYEHVMLEDLTYHHLGVIHYMIGAERFNQVFATSVLPSWSIEKSPSVVSLLAQSNEGLHLNYYASWAAHSAETSWLGEFQLDGSEGSLQLRGDRLVFIHHDGAEETIVPDESNGFELRAGIVNEFMAACMQGRKSDLDISSFQPVIRMIQASLESVRTGNKVDI